MAGLACAGALHRTGAAAALFDRSCRVAAPECWVAHATPEWSRDHLERPADAVLASLRAFAAEARIRAAPRFAAVHRWRYALAEAPLGTPALWDAAAGLGACGD